MRSGGGYAKYQISADVADGQKQRRRDFGQVKSYAAQQALDSIWDEIIPKTVQKIIVKYQGGTDETQP